MFVLVNQKSPDGRSMLRLLTESGPLRGKIFKLSPPLATVGRAQTNSVHIPLPYIADHHFDIEINGDQVILRDCGEEGGTLVNDELVDVVYLQHGDRIAFGEIEASTSVSTPFGAPAAAPLGPAAGVAAGPAPGMHEIFLAEHSVNVMADDVMTVLGTPLARFGSAQPPAPVRPKMPPPPGSPPVMQVPPQNDWHQRKLEVLLAVGKALSRPEQITEKINRVLQLLFDSMDIDRAAILVLSEQGEQEAQEESMAQLGSVGAAGAQSLQVGDWNFNWCAYRDPQGPTETLPLSSTVIHKVLSDSVAVMTQDAQAEDWLDGARSVFGQAIRTCICTPLKTSSGVLGVLYADSSKTSHPFSREDMEFFTAFSNQAAVAIENTRLIEVALQKERMEQDLRVAKKIQEWLFPQNVPTLQGFELAGDSNAMEEVGGDYFDYIMLNDHTIAMVVADVSGHGISSALIMTMTRSILRGSLMANISPAEILQRVNHLVSEDMITRMFVTVLLVVVDLRTGQFTFSHAGHNPPLLYRAHLQQITALDVTKSSPIGMSRWARLKPTYTDQQDILYPGDILCLYTDGFPEAMNPSGEEMDLEPLQQVIAYHAQYPAATILQQAFVRLHHFMAGSPSTDDTTAIILKRTQ